MTARWGGAKQRKARGIGGAPALQSTAAVLAPANAANGNSVDILTLTITGCGSGVGVGLDKENIVDMLVPDRPAAQHLQVRASSRRVLRTLCP